MKSIRHTRIKDIIENKVIETQEELAEELRKKSIDVTQATVSRDIKELMLIKLPTGDGRYRYAFPLEKNVVFSQSRMVRMFQDSVTSIDYSENIIVIKTLPGAANAVASTLDYAKWPEIIGTVAGDDNILAVIKPIQAVEDIVQRLKNLSM
ncbi:MAG: arginine repressor [Negativicutes bacterium]|jgi:transcriptional regulator of arginine metabolism|nr:arginine repressor [Negativicutes bacterium]MBP8628981.1 arginine repressor [Negativicutes bacterium]MBP9536919.1 arginine repressor [Negativicutes bacterium]MBP9949166.1 arginine repressor [Negativicutes bacterium]